MKLKLQLLWAIIRGRTVAYRVTVDEGGIVVRTPGAMFVECEISGQRYGIRAVANSSGSVVVGGSFSA